MKGRSLFICGFFFFNYWDSIAQTEPVGVAVGGCKEWRGYWVEVPCASSTGTSNEKVPSGPTKRQQRIAAHNERIDKANNLKDQANQAALRNDAKEALRLAKAAQDMANDHKWLKEWIVQLEDFIRKEEIRKQANELRNKYYVSSKSYDLREAYSSLKQASSIDPASLTAGEREWLYFIEKEIKKDPLYLETNTDAKENLIQNIKNFSKTLDTSSLGTGLSITTSKDIALNITGAEENDYFSELISSIQRLAERLNWRTDEQLRLKMALDSLGMEIYMDNEEWENNARKAWAGVVSRGETPEIKRQTINEIGLGLPSAGQQSFQDCTIFALANATGLPYGIVAARAAKLISEAEWRTSDERSNPQKVIREEGLYGGEVLFLAEAFGQVEIIESIDFEKIAREGRPILVNILNGHQVVISKAIQHNGKTWYEMIDSNLKGPWERRYVTDEELKAIISENGIVIRPEPGTVPKFLR